MVTDLFPAASGVVARMTLEQAASRQTDRAVLKEDEAYYRVVFHRMPTGGTQSRRKIAILVVGDLEGRR